MPIRRKRGAPPGADRYIGIIDTTEDPMKTINRTIGDVFREVGRATQQVGRSCMRALSRMSWPALLASCIMMALLLTILPLALTLFAIFLLLKVAIAIIAGHSASKRTHTQEHKEH
jgi:hypothetical protein